jgi:hypothetical protein
VAPSLGINIQTRGEGGGGTLPVGSSTAPNQAHKLARTAVFTPKNSAFPLTTEGRVPARIVDTNTFVLPVNKRVMAPTPVPIGNGGEIYSQCPSAHRLGCKSNVNSNCICCHYPSPIIVSELIPLLSCYPIASAAHILREGFLNGFKLGFKGMRGPKQANNLISAQNDPATVKKKLQKEIVLGRMAGPFVQAPYKDLFVSPIGIVPKAEAGKFRLIHHLSFPEGGLLMTVLIGRSVKCITLALTMQSA